MALYRNEENCWFYGDAAVRPDVQADVQALQAGATRLRPGEVVVRIDGGAVLYVMPEDWFATLRGLKEGVLAIMARDRAEVALEQTALHRNVAVLPGGEVWDAHTFGNFMGGGAFLAGPVADGGALAPLAGKKLAGVTGRFREDGSFDLRTWQPRS